MLPRLTLAGWLAAVLAIVSPPPATAMAELVADFNQELGPERSGSPNGFVQLGGLAYFSACDRVHGCELWASDGTTANTRVVADLCPGACSSSPRELYVAFGTTLYFAADDGFAGREPWAYRPDLVVPRRVADVAPGALDSTPLGFVAVDAGNLSGVFFVAQQRYPGIGRPDSIYRVVESGATFTVSQVLAPGQLREIGKPVALGNRLLFAAKAVDGASGNELWRLQAPLPGVFGASLVLDINPGEGDAFVQELTVHPTLGLAFFSAVDGFANAELWRSDGTPAGTTKVREIALGLLGSRPRGLTPLGNRLVFVANDNGANAEPWITDGSALQTVKLAEIHPDPGVGSGPHALRALGAQVVFLANDGVSGFELWRTDGTPAGTGQLADLVSGFNGIVAFEGNAATLVAGGFYYVAGSSRLFRSDGTPVGTRLVGSPVPGATDSITGLGASAQRLLFGLGLAGRGAELFQTRFDTPSTVSLVLDIGDEIGHSDPIHLLELGGGEIFAAFEPTHGYEMRRSSGSGIELLADLQNGANTFPTLSLPPRRDPFDPARAWFVDFAARIWRSDGSVAGTRTLALSALPGSDPSGLSCLTPRGDRSLLLLRNNTTAGFELWESDGTAAGSRILLRRENLPAGIALDDRLCPELAGATIVLSGTQDGVAGIFGSDGTPGGTRLLATLPSGSGSQRLRNVARTGTRVFFAANGAPGDASVEPWVTDGTPAGTRMLDINPTGSSLPHGFVPFGADVLFIATDGSSGFELYRSDGTVAGTRRVVDLYAGISSAFPDQSTQALLVPADGGVYFAATVPAGKHLFFSDGSAAGTRRVVDDGAGTVPLWPQDITALRDGGVVFSAYLPETGREAWFSGGTAASTFLVADVAPGPLGSSPSEFAATREGVIFSADDVVRGREPWRLRLSQRVFDDGFE